MSKKILKCPYCGSTRANRTGLGWAESAAKGIGAFGVGLVVASLIMWQVTKRPKTLLRAIPQNTNVNHAGKLLDIQIKKAPIDNFFR